MLERTNSPTPSPQPSTPISDTSEGALLCRAVKWFKGEGLSANEQTWHRTATWAAVFFLTVSIVGIPLLILGAIEYKRQLEEALKKQNEILKKQMNALTAANESLASAAKEA